MVARYLPTALLLVLFMLVFSHLTVDKDFNKATKVVAYIVMGVILVWFIFFSKMGV